MAKEEGKRRRKRRRRRRRRKRRRRKDKEKEMEQGEEEVEGGGGKWIPQKTVASGCRYRRDPSIQRDDPYRPSDSTKLRKPSYYPQLERSKIVKREGKRGKKRFVNNIQTSLLKKEKRVKEK